MTPLLPLLPSPDLRLTDPLTPAVPAPAVWTEKEPKVVAEP